MDNSPVLITGAAGFIGFHTALRLLQAGRKVVGVDNLNDYYDPELKRARLQQLDNFNDFELSPKLPIGKASYSTMLRLNLQAFYRFHN